MEVPTWTGDFTYAPEIDGNPPPPEYYNSPSVIGDGTSGIGNSTSGAGGWNASEGAWTWNGTNATAEQEEMPNNTLTPINLPVTIPTNTIAPTDGRPPGTVFMTEMITAVVTVAPSEATPAGSNGENKRGLEFWWS